MFLLAWLLTCYFSTMKRKLIMAAVSESKQGDNGGSDNRTCQHSSFLIDHNLDWRFRDVAKG